jgi:hypothetical protein
MLVSLQTEHTTTRKFPKSEKSDSCEVDHRPEDREHQQDSSRYQADHQAGAMP